MQWNAKSLDGLHGLKSARKDLGQRLWLEDRKASFLRVLAQSEALTLGIVIGVLLALIARLGQEFLLTE